MQKSLLVLFLLLLPSCFKYHRIFKGEVPQGTEKERNLDIINHNVKTVSVYDQFTTKAIFDVLWLSDEARDYYVELYTNKHGLTDILSEAMLRRQLEENRHWVTFFVLSYIPEEGNNVLSDKEASWSFCLQFLSGKKVTPSQIKEVALAPEIKYFFGKKLTSFKTAYLVKFDVEDDVFFKNVSEKNFKLVISSVDRDVYISWQEQQSINIKKRINSSKQDGKYKQNENFYWL